MLARPRGVARRDLEPARRDPVGHVLRSVLLEEELPERAVGIALHRERPLAQVRHDDGGDVAVVREQVALRDPLLRPERLVQVGQLQHARAAPQLGRDRVTLAADVLGALVLAQSLVRRRAQAPVVGPLDELHLADELGLDPDHVPLAHLRQLRHLVEGRLRSLEGTQERQQLLDLGVVEPRADIADVAKAAALGDGEHERAEAAAASALTLRVAGDHELLPAVGLDLQPVPGAPPGLVDRVCALGDDPLEALLLGRLVERVPVLERIGDLDAAAPLVDELGQPLATLGQRQPDERLALDLEHVERDVDVRRALLALLHGREGRAPVRADRHHLAVEHAVGRAQGAHERAHDGGEALVQRVAVAAAQLDLPASHRRDRPVAVPLHLEEPAVARRHLAGERREHRPVGRPGFAASRPRRRAPSSSRAASSSGRRRASPGRASTAPPAARRAGARSARRRASPRRARRCPGPRSRRCRRRSSPSGSCPRRWRSRAGGPRRGRRDAACPARAEPLSAPPSSRARRHARA